MNSLCFLVSLLLLRAREIQLITGGAGSSRLGGISSQISEDTVLIIMGDHGNGVVPLFRGITKLEEKLLWPRIILGVLSGKISHPEPVSYPVHQMDVAPMIAELAGIKPPKSWLGRNPLSGGKGTPWIKRQGAFLLYRTDDPLMTTFTQFVPDDPRETERMRSIIDANEAYLELSGGQ